jgi:hypothetical protein
MRAANSVEVRGAGPLLAAGVLGWIAGALFVGLVYGDLMTMATIGAAIAAGNVHDSRIVRRWEAEHDVRLAWMRRSRRDRWRHPLSTRHAVALSSS